MLDEIRKKFFDTVIIGCDHSKSSHWIRFYREAHGESDVYQIKNTRKDFKRILRLLGKFKKEYGGDEVIFISESTSNYGLPLLRYLQKSGIKIYQVNPKHTKRIREISDNSPNKTDKKDPDVVINAFIHGVALSAPVHAPDKANLRVLTNYREELLTAINQSLNRLEAKLAAYFPEYLQVMKGLKVKTSRYLLYKYPSPRLMAKAPLEGLEKEMIKVSRGRLGKERAKAVHKAAIQTVGIDDHIDAIELIVRKQLSNLQALYDQADEIEKEITAELKKIPEAKYILSIKGIGLNTTAVIIAEIGDFKSFSQHKKILKYAGLNLFEISSGKIKGQRRISKRGRAMLRKALYFAAMNTIREGGTFHKVYKEKTDNGMLKKKALVMISKKILKVIYSLVKHQQYFDKKLHYKHIEEGKNQIKEAA